MDRGSRSLVVPGAIALAMYAAPAFAQNLIVQGTTTGEGNAQFQQALRVEGPATFNGPVTGIATMPTGAVISFAGAAPPSGYLLCNGAAVSRSTYSALFAVVGTTYGPGDGVNTFNLPDLRGRTAVGAGLGAGLTDRPLASSGGAEAHTLTASQMPWHSHTATSSQIGHRHAVGGAGSTRTWGAESWAQDSWDGGAWVNRITGYNSVTSTSAQGPAVSTTIGSTGGGAAHSIMQPWHALNFIIKI